MSEAPILKRLILSRDACLPFVDLELSDPESGGMISELCLIGPNGTGKSALLSRLHLALTGVSPETSVKGAEADDGLHLAKYTVGGEDLWLARRTSDPSGETKLFRTSLEESGVFRSLHDERPNFEGFCESSSEHLAGITFPAYPSGSFAWFDAERCLVDGIPSETLEVFLASLLREREEAFHRFLRAPENRDKTVAEVERDFENHSPHALILLREVWGRFLEPASLRVDFGLPDGPFFTMAGTPFPLARLGRSLRQTLLRTGLAFSREILPEAPATSLFLDQPEEGLHPDLTLNLIPLYRALPGPGSPRLFVVTHSPLIAASFAPARRLRLAMDREGNLTLSGGLAAEGASPDEVLKTDFGIAELQPRHKGTSDPRTSRLRRAIRASDDEDELADLIDEAISIRKF